MENRGIVVLYDDEPVEKLFHFYLRQKKRVLPLLTSLYDEALKKNCVPDLSLNLETSFFSAKVLGRFFFSPSLIREIRFPTCPM
jgi:hypothetical protein